VVAGTAGHHAEEDRMRIAAFGDNIVDRFVDRRIAYPGGNCVNVAVFAAGEGAEALYMGVVGDDDNGTLILDALEACGVDASFVQRRHGPTGVTDMETRDGDRVFLTWNDGGVTTSDPYRLDEESLAALAPMALVHSSVYSASESELPALRGLDGVVTFDYSSEPEFRTDAYLARTAPYADLVLFSGGDEPEAALLELMGRALQHGPRLALATRGAAGALLTDGSWVLREPAVEVPAAELVDTTGCGDAFLAAFVLSLLRAGWRRDRLPSPADCRRALAAGAQRAARQCHVAGAFGMGVSYVRDDDRSVLSGSEDH